MRLTIVSRSVRLSDAVRGHVERRTQFALGRFAAAIRTVRVTLLDENGPRGGVDKRCRVLLSPRRGKPIVVDGRGERVLPLIDHTLERAGRTLARAVRRMAEPRSEGRPIR
jgi:putative sigma-54 modulation protein